MCCRRVSQRRRSSVVLSYVLSNYKRKPHIKNANKNTSTSVLESSSRKAQNTQTHKSKTAALMSTTTGGQSRNNSVTQNQTQPNLHPRKKLSTPAATVLYNSHQRDENQGAQQLDSLDRALPNDISDGTHIIRAEVGSRKRKKGPGLSIHHGTHTTTDRSWFKERLKKRIRTIHPPYDRTHTSYRQKLKALMHVAWYTCSSLELVLRMSSTARYVSHRNFSHGTTISRSVRSFSPSSVIVDSMMLSGVASASRSPTFAASTRDIWELPKGGRERGEGGQGHAPTVCAFFRYNRTIHCSTRITNI